MKPADRAMQLEGLILKLADPLNSEGKLRFLGNAGMRFMAGWRLKSMNCEKILLGRPDGTKMRVCVMRGKLSQRPAVGVLWLHGGGYAVAAPEMAVMSFSRLLVAHENCVIVSPDYTLSIHKPFPAAL